MKPSENNGIVSKIMIAVIAVLISGFLGWGTWITVAAFEIEDIRMCATKNEATIEKRASSLQIQINKRMDKQERKMDRQNDKLDKIMMILIDIKNKER